MQIALCEARFRASCSVRSIAARSPARRHPCCAPPRQSTPSEPAAQPVSQPSAQAQQQPAPEQRQAAAGVRLAGAGQPSHELPPPLPEMRRAKTAPAHVYDSRTHLAANTGVAGAGCGGHASRCTSQQGNQSASSAVHGQRSAASAAAARVSALLSPHRHPLLTPHPHRTGSSPGSTQPSFAGYAAGVPSMGPPFSGPHFDWDDDDDDASTIDTFADAPPGGEQAQWAAAQAEGQRYRRWVAGGQLADMRSACGRSWTLGCALRGARLGRMAAQGT